MGSIIHHVPSVTLVQPQPLSSLSTTPATALVSLHPRLSPNVRFCTQQPKPTLKSTRSHDSPDSTLQRPSITQTPCYDVHGPPHLPRPALCLVATATRPLAHAAPATPASFLFPAPLRLLSAQPRRHTFLHISFLWELSSTPTSSKRPFLTTRLKDLCVSMVTVVTVFCFLHNTLFEII